MTASRGPWEERVRHFPSERTAEDAVDLAEKSGDSYSKAMAYVSLGGAWYRKGLFNDALIYLVQGVDLSHKNHILAWSLGGHDHLGDTYAELEEYGKAAEQYQHAIRINEETGIFPSWAAKARMGLARCMWRTHGIRPNFDLLHEYVKSNSVKFYAGHMRRSMAEILLELDGGTSCAAAEPHILGAIEADEQYGTIWDLGMDHALYGEFFKLRGDRQRAQEQLGKAIEILRQCGADGWVAKYEKELAAFQ